MYKNWLYVKERDNLDIRPFARGWFGIFFCCSLLNRIHEDKDARAIQAPSFSPNGLAIGWIVLWLFDAVLSRFPGSIMVMVISVLTPTFLCLVPIQNYINVVNRLRLPNLPFYRWSFGHFICLIPGIILWAFLFLSLGAV